MTEDRNKINWGGPAFPELGNVGYNSDWQSENGMTLRDYFAGQALASIPIRSWDQVGDDEARIKAWAKCAYQCADAMLSVRNGESDG